MRTDAIINITRAANTTKDHSVGRGHLNGLLISSKGIRRGDKLTIRRRTEKRTHVLLSSNELEDLMRVSAQADGINPDGASANQNLVVNLLNSGNLPLANANDWFTRLGDQGQLMFYLPLGSIYLNADSELDIDVAFGSTAANDQFEIFMVSHSKTPDVMLQYVETNDLERRFQQVDSLWLMRKDGTSLRAVSYSGGAAPYTRTETVTSFNVQVDDEESSWLSNQNALIAATNTFGRVEEAYQTFVAQVYRTPDGLPRNIYVRVTGGNSADVRLLARHFVYDDDLVRKNTRAEINGLKDRIERMEKENEELASALRATGQTVKAEVLEEIKKQADAAAKAEEAAKKSA